MILTKRYRTRVFWIGLCVFGQVAVFGQRKQINIADLGAGSDGKTDNTMLIQKAIDVASESGNGKVIIPAGKFLTGVLHLKSNVELHLEKDAFLLGSTKRADYGPSDASALIDATNQHHIAITGKGTIDGQGSELIKNIYEMLQAGTLMDREWQSFNPWHQMRPEERNRPKILRIFNCDSVVLKGISLKNALCWVQDIRNSSNILVDSIYVESNVMWNNDGIDLTDCKNVRVTNSFFNCDDDGICLKSSTRNLCCENIYVANCTVRASASGIKLGTASRGGFKKVTIHDVKVYDTYRSAIAIEGVDGGVVDGIDIRNIQATNTGNAIFIRLGHRNTDPVYSQLRNVYIGNVRVEIPSSKPDRGYPYEGPEVDGRHNVFPSSVVGLPGHPVQNVVIENVEMVYQGGGNKQVACFSADSLSKVPEREAEYPEFSMFGELPSWGFYSRHVEGLVLKNVTLTAVKPDYRSAALFDDVLGLKITGLSVSGSNVQPVLFLNKSPKPVLEALKLPLSGDKAIHQQ